LSAALKSTIAGLDPGVLPWWRRGSFWCLPARCYFCGDPGDLGAVDLCSHCVDRLPWLEAPQRGASGTGPMAVSAFAYAEPIDRALKALKFGGDRAAARVLGALLAAVVSRAISAGLLRTPDVLLPIPLHANRLATRGFNQAGLLAQQTALWLQRPVLRRGLVRVRSTQPQTALHAAERRCNVAGAFRPATALQRLAVRKPLRIALVDDVTTTGATLEAARAALQQGGVAEVQLWSVATAMPSHTVIPT